LLLLATPATDAIGSAGDSKERTSALVATLALTSTPLPIVGAVWPLAAASTPAFVRSSAPLAIGILVVLAFAAALLSFAAHRFQYLSFDSAKKASVEPLGMVLAAASVVIPTLAAFSPRAVGGDAEGPIATFVPPALPTIGMPALAACLVLLGAFFVGRTAAKRRYESKKGWRERDAKVVERLALLAWLDHIAGVVPFVFDGVRRIVVAIARAIEENVIVFATRAIGALVWVSGWLTTHVEEAPLAENRIARTASRVPARAAAVVFAVAIVALALMALVSK
jgi:hypothetical protein